jgi:hypothetical protein
MSEMFKDDKKKGMALSYLHSKLKWLPKLLWQMETPKAFPIFLNTSRAWMSSEKALSFVVRRDLFRKGYIRLITKNGSILDFSSLSRNARVSSSSSLFISESFSSSLTEEDINVL